MARLLPTFSVLLSMITLSGPTYAVRGTLHADGILTVRHAALSQAKVRVVPAGAQAYELPMGTERFVLDLPVDDTYLISFERQGCPTKEIYFDATVPVELSGKDFEFRFKVTLEYLEEEHMFTYAGPVGFVRYMHPTKDFGYETDYAIKMDERLKERMEEFKATGVDPHVIVAPTAAMVVDRARNGEVISTQEARTNADVAPLVREIPKMVHYLGRATEDVAATAAVPEVVAPVPLIVPAPAIVAVAPVPALTEVSVVQPIVVETAVVDKVAPQEEMSIVPVEVSNIDRQEEVIVQPRMVLKVVRLTHANGRVEELRKVTHAYGATFFFQNQQSISEDQFLRLYAQH